MGVEEGGSNQALGKVKPGKWWWGERRGSVQPCSAAISGYGGAAGTAGWAAVVNQAGSSINKQQGGGKSVAMRRIQITTVAKNAARQETRNGKVSRGKGNSRCERQT